MRAVVVCLLLLAACTVETACGPDEMPLELGGCCLDADGNGQCDAREAPATSREESLPEEELPVVNQTVVPEPADERSLTERLEDEFFAGLQTFSYYTESEYGKLWVWMEPGETLYLPVQNLLIVEDGIAARSAFDHLVTRRSIVEEIEERRLPVMSMLACSEETGKCDGCFVDSDFFSMENCVEDWPNGNPVIEYDVQFSPPEGPLDWLRVFHRVPPDEIRANRTFRSKDGHQYLVDEIEFSTRAGTTVLYVHTGFGIPVQVDELDSAGRVAERVVFERPVYNTHQLPTGLPRLEPIYRE